MAEQGFVEGEKVCIRLQAANQEAKNYYEGISAFIVSNPQSAFLTPEHYAIDPSGEAFLFNVQFTEIAQSLAQLLTRKDGNWGFEAVLDLIDSVLGVLNCAETLLPGYFFPIDAVYLTSEGMVKLCPFLDLKETAERHSAIIEIFRQKEEILTRENASLAQEVVEKVKELKYEEVALWLRRVREERKPQLVEKLNKLIEKYPNWQESEVKDLLTLQNLTVKCNFDLKCSLCQDFPAVQRFPCGHFTCIHCHRSDNSCPKCSVPSPRLGQSSALEELKCVECGADLPRTASLLGCNVHGFCNEVCQTKHISHYFPHSSWIPAICLSCNRFEEKVIASDAVPNGLSILKSISDLKEKCRASQGREFEVCVELADSVVELLFMSSKPVYSTAQWPLCLSHRLLSEMCYLLRCCFCQKNVFVHRRNNEEMRKWGDRPFLIKCDFKLHAVCSQACFVKGVCPICSNSRIHDWLLQGKEHPTIEALRRSASVACRHPETRRTMPLYSCSHELCEECIESQQQHFGFVTCRICGSQCDFGPLD